MENKQQQTIFFVTQHAWENALVMDLNSILKFLEKLPTLSSKVFVT